VFVWERKRVATERSRDLLKETKIERERMSLCVCVCERERERVKESCYCN
jgi:hypothetical protein